jgi:hypothetical protein
MALDRRRGVPPKQLGLRQKREVEPITTTEPCGMVSELS